MEIMSTAISSGTHVVLMPYPSAGHSGPFVHFAKHLARAGVAVSFMAPDSETSSLNHSLEIDADDSRHRRNMITVVPFAFPIHQEEMGAAFFFYIRDWMQSQGDTFHDIVARLVHADAGPPVCIISDMFLGFTQGIADKLGIRRYCLYSSPAHFLSFTFHFPQLYSEGRLPATSWVEPPFRIPNFPPIPTGDLPPALHTASNAANTFFLEESKPLWRAAGVIVNTVHELEAPVIDGLRKFLADNSPLNQAPTIMTTGPVLEGLWEGEDSMCSFRERTRASPERPRDACFDWLDEQPDTSVLYVCYGSITMLSAAQVLELAMGLENSGQRFLWVLRIPKKGLEVLPEGFLERTKARGWVYTDWAPQLHILAHRAVGGFLSHCGWNSATESMCMGVPMIAMPVQGDQTLNATLIANVLRVGIRINDIGAWFHTVHRETIAAAVRVVMSDDEMRRKAAQVSATIQVAVRPGGSSRENLSLLVQHLKSLPPLNATSSSANSMA